MAEALHRPATLRRDAAKRPVRIDRDRMADGLEERDVGGRVRVGRRAREVDPLDDGELAERDCLGIPVQPPFEPSGVVTIADLRPRGDRTVEPEPARNLLADLLQPMNKVADISKLAAEL